MGLLQITPSLPLRVPTVLPRVPRSRQLQQRWLPDSLHPGLLLSTPATATSALTAIPDCAKAAQSGSPGAGDPGMPCLRHSVSIAALALSSQHSAQTAAISSQHSAFSQGNGKAKSRSLAQKLASGWQNV